MRGRLTAAAIAIAAVLSAGAAEAKTFEVTRANDPNPGKCKQNDCSLREAVLAASARPGKDKVVLPGRRYKLSRGGADEDEGLTGDLDVTGGPISIAHPGRGSAKIDGNELDRVLNVLDTSSPMTLQEIVVMGGAVAGDGAGIATESNLRLRSSSIKDNSGTGLGADGGAIDLDEDGKLTMKRSALLGNSADGNGGAVNGSGAGMVLTSSRVSGNQAAEEGGGLDTLTGETVRITRSTIENNDAADGGGIEAAAASLIVKQSTIVGNTAAGNGGGIFKDDLGTIALNRSTVSGNRAQNDGTGGGVHISVGALTAVNSTLAGNQAEANGGGINAAEGATVNLNAVTIARNVANSDAPLAPALQGGGIYEIDSTFELRNTIVALNGSGVSGLVDNDCEGDTFLSLGNNLISTDNDGECEGFTQPTDVEDPAPGLAQLKRNGGPTKTIALKGGSPAIGNADNGTAPGRDQRGRKRDNQPDIGAFERGA
jgi:hypothetical protein